MQKKTMQMTTAALLLMAGLAMAGEVNLPEPQSGLLVLPKGMERQTYRICGRTQGPVDQHIIARLAWDEEGLMATIKCSDTNVVAEQGAGRDNPDAWKDDAVELLLEPGHRHGAPVCIGLSAAGAVWDSRGADRGFNVEGLVARSARTRDGWRATLVIPWTGLGVAVPKDGEVWGFNIKRIDHDGAFALDKMKIGSWLPFNTDSQDVMLNGQVAFVLPETLENDEKLEAMRRTVADGHAAAARAWAGPNDGDTLVLDGDQPVTLSTLGRIGSGVPARQATQVKVSRNETGLVVDFECEDADISATMEGRDNTKLWKDDCVYVWLDPAHDHEGMIMVQVSAAGVINDSKGSDSKWNLDGLVAETKRTDTGWTAHLLLPFAGLLAPNASPLTTAAASAAAWGFNLTRMDQPGTYDYFNMQMLSLALIPGEDAGAMHRWGHLAFGKAARPVAASHIARKAAVDQQCAANAAAAEAKSKEFAKSWGIPANPNASENACKVLKLLCDLPQRKDTRFILCQENWSYDGGNAGGFKEYVEALAEKSGKWIGMIHVSYGNATVGESTEPGYREYLADANKNAIRYWKAGGLVTVHINPVNPITNKGGSDGLKERERIAEVLQPGTEAHRNWLATLDRYAVLLAELRDAGVVVLWRPLHEMTFKNCYWYDAGATRDWEIYKNIWRHMFRYYSEEKKLDNLLWVYSSTGLNGKALGSMAADDMYPGGEFVDIVGFSAYADDVDILGGVYENLTSLGKPFALTEFGPGHSGTLLSTDDKLSNLDLVDAVREKYPLATYAAYWGSWPGANMAIIHMPHAVELVNHPWVANRDELGVKDVKVENK